MIFELAHIEIERSGISRVLHLADSEDAHTEDGEADLEVSEVAREVSLQHGRELLLRPPVGVVALLGE